MVINRFIRPRVTYFHHLPKNTKCSMEDYTVLFIQKNQHITVYYTYHTCHKSSYNIRNNYMNKLIG